MTSSCVQSCITFGSGYWWRSSIYPNMQFTVLWRSQIAKLYGRHPPNSFSLECLIDLDHRFFAMWNVIYIFVPADKWIEVFRVVSGSGLSVYSSWANPGWTYTDMFGNYKHQLLDEWNNVKEVGFRYHMFYLPRKGIYRWFTARFW